MSCRSAPTSSGRTSRRSAPRTFVSGLPRSTAATTGSSSGARSAGGRGRMKHLLSIDDLGRDGIVELCDLAETFLEVTQRDIPKVPALRGKTVATVFYEDSTRTRLSFETAAKRLSADTMSFSAVELIGPEGREPARHGTDDRGARCRRDGRATPRRGRPPPRRRLGRRVGRQRRRRSPRAPDPGAPRHLHVATPPRTGPRWRSRGDRR